MGRHAIAIHDSSSDPINPPSVKADGPAIDEERRLCYVGVTRARDRLTLSPALSRMKWGKPRPTNPSRFLFEITGQADGRTT